MTDDDQQLLQMYHGMTLPELSTFIHGLALDLNLLLNSADDLHGASVRLLYCAHRFTLATQVLWNRTNGSPD